MSSSAARVGHVLLSSAHVNGSGGVQVILRSLVAGLQQTGRRVSFVYDTPLPRLSVRKTTNAIGCPAFGLAMPAPVRDSAILSLAVFAAFAPIAFVNLARVIRRERIDIVNCHYIDTYLVHLVMAARLLRVPVVVSVHGADVDRYGELAWVQQWFFRLIMRGATQVVACSQALAEQTARTFPGTRSKTTWIHNGLDVSPRVPAAAPSGLPRRFVLCVCRQVWKKGVDVLLRAYVRVAAAANDVPLVLVGDGPLIDDHKALASSLGIDRYVTFAGNVPHDHLEPYFEACTLFVLPSRVEPFGLVVLEAARSCKAIVATRVGGIPEILTDGVDGVLVAPDDSNALADEIILLLQQPGVAAQLGERAQHTLVTKFLWKDRVKEYIDLFESVWTGRRVRPSAVPVGARQGRNDFGKPRPSRSGTRA